ncbi:MAG: phosphatase PAP2 family protein [Vicinamibacterales bacterium]
MPIRNARLATLTLMAVCASGPAALAQSATSDGVAPSALALERPRPDLPVRGSAERVGPLSPLSTPRLLPTMTMAEPAPSAWRDLFSPAWSDVRRFPSRQTMQWLLVGAVAATGARHADSHIGQSLSKADQLREVSEPGALIGSTPLQLGLSAASYALGRATSSPRMTAAGADLFRAQLLAQGLTIGMKEAVRRKRPEGGGFAFPSGHSTVSFASATVLQQHFGWRVGAPAYALASYVALSRVQMKRHYLSDVAFGAALGIAAGRTITLDRQRRMQLAPMAADGGAGVQFVWTGR